MMKQRDIINLLADPKAFESAISEYERRMEEEQKKLDRMGVALRRAREIHNLRRLNLSKRSKKS